MRNFIIPLLGLVLMLSSLGAQAASLDSSSQYETPNISEVSKSTSETWEIEVIYEEPEESESQSTTTLAREIKYVFDNKVYRVNDVYNDSGQLVSVEFLRLVDEGEWVLLVVKQEGISLDQFLMKNPHLQQNPNHLPTNSWVVLAVFDVEYNEEDRKIYLTVPKDAPVSAKPVMNKYAETGKVFSSKGLTITQNGA